MYLIEYDGINENMEYENIIEKVINKCFEIEHLPIEKLQISILLTIPKKIKELNNKYRNIDKETDVLSFPMFEKDEIFKLIKEGKLENEDILGDMVISIPQVEIQAKEYGHSFERELSYMVVHSFYHLMGYDHINEEEKKVMREKEENVLSLLDIKR